MKYRYERYGYVFIWNPQHPSRRSNGYVKRSRLTMEAYLGRYLDKREVVHHINEIKNDDRIENLKLYSSNSEHISKTKKGHNHTLRKFLRIDGIFPSAIGYKEKIVFKRKTYIVKKCVICNKEFWTKHRTERKISSTCNKECFKKYMSKVNLLNWAGRR